MRNNRMHRALALALCAAAVAPEEAAGFAGGIREYGRKDSGGDDLDKIKTEVKEALATINAQVKSFVDANKAKIEDGAKFSEGVKAVVDDLLTKQGGLMTRLQDIEQKLDKATKGGGGNEDPDTLEAVLAKAWDGEEVKAFLADPRSKRSIAIPISRKALTNTGVTGAALNYPGQQILSMPLMPLLRRLTIRDLLAPGRTNKPVVFYPRESGYTNNAAVVSEGSLKPKSDLTFDLITDPVRTIAHLQDISLQMLDDVTYIASYIENRMRYALKLTEEAELLNGSGTGQHLLGIYTAATAYVQPSGSVVQAETDIDKLRLALLQVELAEAFATGIVLHPTNWANIELLKNTQNNYLFTNPQATATGRLWGRDVVSTQALTLGKFLVGDFAQHAQILDRQDATVAISFENKDNFERNMATLRVEERLALAIYRPEAFIKGTLESASH